MGDDMKICRILGTGIAALSLLAVSFQAEAADIPRPVYKGPVRSVVAYYNWTGLYVGINGGYAWGDSNWFSPAISNKPKGGLVGGTLGYNYQLGSWVLGIEGDYDWADIKDSVACGAFTCETKNSWLATVRGRIGYAFDRWLPYFTGGAAFGKVEANSTNPAAPGASDTLTGWTVGAGVEYAFLGNWSAKIEYLYVDLGNFNCGTSCAVGVVSNDVDYKANVIRAGINYKFSGPIFSRY
jgi:outer membrane immunogenic protein